MPTGGKSSGWLQSTGVWGERVVVLKSVRVAAWRIEFGVVVLRIIVCGLLSGACASALAQTDQQFVQQAVRTELAADAADHTHWLYCEQDRTPGMDVKQWVAQSNIGDLKRVLEKNGQALSTEEQRSSVDRFIGNPAAQQKQRKSGQQDDRQAAQMLRLLPQAFLWTRTGEHDGETTLHFKPDPKFDPPTWESRVFAAMEGDMTVDNAQHRIASIKGKMIHEVKFWGGMLGDIKAGGTFDAERREIGSGEWQITTTHVHIQGHALLFKDISDQEDDEKTQFKRLPDSISGAAAEKELFAASAEPSR